MYGSSGKSGSTLTSASKNFGMLKRTEAVKTGKMYFRNVLRLALASFIA